MTDGTTRATAFAPLPDGEKAPAREERILRFWDEADIFRKSMEPRTPDSPNFVFYEGPPTANAMPGVHHAAARIVKDLFCRYQTMRGKRVLRKGGWDCHGLPVELEVEKALGLSTKGDVEKYGVAAFNAKCRERVTTFADEWTRLSRRIGFWTDMDDPYLTYTRSYVESVWSILKAFFDSDFIFQGHKVVPYCPRCETSLSSHEVSQGYRDVQDPSVFVRFRIPGEGAGSFLVWTTTPWTLISNVALAVHPEISYLLADVGDDRMWIAEGRANEVLDGEWSVLEKKTGAELVALGLSYEPLFPYADAGEGAYRLVTADFVTVDDGTGIVHMAPAFGEDDSLVARREGLPTVQPVDASGRFTDIVEPWAGKFVKDADPDIIRDLKTRGILYKRVTIDHPYPHCWRCRTPLLYYAKQSWFLRTTKWRDDLVARNRRIDWHPPEIGTGRFGEWLSGNIDWNLSRDRYWGTPLPIWRCGECGPEKDVCIGSISELADRSGRDLGDFDPHKPHVDEIEIPCGACRKPMRRTPEVIDAWFDSGSMPFAQWHYPFENRELIENGASSSVPWERRTQYPADFISEGLDQTRGWFYSLLAISTLLARTGNAPIDDASYRRCVVIGLIQDDEGKKMSKSRGNVVDPWSVLDTEGADALRWYLIATSPPWISKRFSGSAVGEAGRRFLGTLENLYSFFALYAGIDGYTPSPGTTGNDLAGEPGLTYLDRWVLGRLEQVTEEAGSALDRYDATSAAVAVQGLVVDDLSNWYVRLSRRRFWAEGMEADKRAAYATLHRCLERVSRLIAPFVPFFAEDLYSRLAGEGDRCESVHLADFPSSAPLDAEARTRDTEVDTTRRVVTLGRAARNDRGLKVRQPLGKAWVTTTDRGDAWLDRNRELVLGELNLNSIEPLSEEQLQGRVRLSLRLRFDRFGPRLGKKAKAFAKGLSGLSDEQMRDYAARRLTTIEVDGEAVELQGDEAEVKREAIAEHEVFAEEAGVGVLLDTTLTEALVIEGFAREVVNKVQFMRKEADFNVTDRIRLQIHTPSDRLRAALEDRRAYVEKETLAVEIGFGKSTGEIAKTWDINGEQAEIVLSRVTA